MVGSHPELTGALVDLLDEEPAITICGVARNGSEAVSLAISERPDLFLVDLEAIDVSAAWIARETRTHVPGGRLVALSHHDDAASVRRILAAGFDRHVSKGAELNHLIPILLEDHVIRH